jgi:hypothetical protein
MTPKQQVIAEVCRSELLPPNRRSWCLSSILERAGLSSDLRDLASQRAAEAALDVLIAYRALTRPSPTAADEFAAAALTSSEFDGTPEYRVRPARDTRATVALRVR